MTVIESIEQHRSNSKHIAIDCALPPRIVEASGRRELSRKKGITYIGLCPKNGLVPI